MAQPLRVEYEGAVYHVMARRQERGAIFRDDADRSRFLENLEGVVRDQRWVIHGYCLMTNHYHLLVETPLANLSVGMHLLNGRYSQAYNLGHARKGHLFEDRFKAIVVEKEAYLLELCRYVVLNPVRAGMVPSAGDTRWSNEELTTAWRRGEERAVGLYLARRLTGLSGVRLGERFGVSGVRVGQLGRDVEGSEDAALRRRVQGLEARIRETSGQNGPGAFSGYGEVFRATRGNRSGSLTEATERSTSRSGQ